MKTISFTVHGVPVPKGRPRATKKGIIYTPSKTRKFEELIAEIASQHKPENGLLKGAIELDFRFYLRRPKSLPESTNPEHVKNPDVDNLAKSVMDGLEGIIYERDAQVTSLVATKEYGEPRVDVRIFTDF